MVRTILVMSVVSLALLGCPPPAANDAGLDASLDGGTDDGGLDGGGSDAGSDGGADAGPTACADRNALKNVYWGDLHVHTGYSVDAYAFGDRATPLDAYAFARGAPVSIGIGKLTNAGEIAQLAPGRTLDFVAVTDHSEWLALGYGCGEDEAHAAYFTDGGAPASAYYGSSTCSFYRSQSLTFNTVWPLQRTICPPAGHAQGTPDCQQVTRSAWAAERLAANTANDRCRFTALQAYEWTYSESGDTLHRNVIFANDSAPELPFDSLDYNSPEKLWTALDRGCLADAGCDVIAIPHNTNLSGGKAFLLPDTSAPVLEQYARYERLIEVHQVKGNSECYWAEDAGIPVDPRCRFENDRQPGAANQIRHGLRKGLGLRESAGVNPFHLGMVGATDTHDGTPGNVAEATWPGGHGVGDDTPDARLRQAINNPGGITGVWAEENTREAIFAAFKRRETFATSGPRIKVRMYAGWDPAGYCTGAFPGNAIAAGAVPMGGTLPPKPAGVTAPTLTVSIARDVVDLNEVDVIKLSSKGGVEQTDLVALTPADPGAACLTWTDPAFDPAAQTLYYVRVLEAASWRWSHYDCLTDAGSGVAGCGAAGNLDRQIRERAWTSPVWFEP